MRKLLSLILAACLLLAPMCFAAAETATEFRTDRYTVTLPEGEWYEKEGIGGLTYYYPVPTFQADQGFIMFYISDLDLGGLETSEYMRDTMYDSLVGGLSAAAVDGKVYEEASEIAGCPARYFAYDQKIGSAVFPVAGDCVMIDGHVLAVCYSHPEMKLEDLKDTVKAMSATVQYDGSAKETAEEETPAEEEKPAETEKEVPGDSAQILTPPTEEYGQPILFRGLAWGCGYDEAVKAMPAGVKFFDLQEEEYWSPMYDMMYEGFNWEQQIRGTIGGQCYAKWSSLDGVKVAGYQLADLDLYFVYVPDNNGKLVRDNGHLALIQGVYKFEPKDLDAAWEDLLAKLTRLYGDVDRSESSDGSGFIDTKMCQWNGADGTMVSLMAQDYTSSSKYIYIKYGFSGGDQLMKNAYDALVRAETEDAAGDVDGL